MLITHLKLVIKSGNPKWSHYMEAMREYNFLPGLNSLAPGPLRLQQVKYLTQIPENFAGL